MVPNSRHENRPKSLFVNCTPYRLRFRAVFKHPASRPAELFQAPPVYKRRSGRVPQGLSLSTARGAHQPSLCTAPEGGCPLPEGSTATRRPLVADPPPTSQPSPRRRFDLIAVSRRFGNPRAALDCHPTVRAVTLRQPTGLPLVGVGGLLTKGRQATLSSPSQGAPEAKARGVPTPTNSRSAESRFPARPPTDVYPVQ